MRFFIDEDLSPRLVGECHRAGYEATCVRDRGMLQTSDREVSALCFAEDRVLVTNNAKDFLILAEKEGLHPGLVFLPLGAREETCSRMNAAIREIEQLAVAAKTDPETLMINNVLEVGEDEGCEIFEYP